MPIPPHIEELRTLVGHRLLWFATTRAVVTDGQGRVLLGRFPGHSDWTIPGGVIDPGEQPADAAARECFEETGIVAVPQAISSVAVSPVVTHPNGDLTQHLDIVFRCQAVGGEPRPRDGELAAAGWFDAGALPEMSDYFRGLLAGALGGGPAAYEFSGLFAALGPEAGAVLAALGRDGS
ncbi:MAG TPA: NUDIX domain-containing protein [Streptosporangiaceae bacterium]|jgi:8-oxo-dGTP pyrophosphatase MutT (NUDIX family)